MHTLISYQYQSHYITVSASVPQSIIIVVRTSAVYYNAHHWHTICIAHTLEVIKFIVIMNTLFQIQKHKERKVH